MSSQPKSLEWADLLCDKGLAKREGLLKFLQGAKHDEVDGLIDSRDVLQIRYDEGVIREVFNARYSSVQPMDARTKKQQIETRSAFLLVVYRLYAAGRARTPAELRRPLQPTEVQTAIAALQRLMFMANPALEEVAAHCERSAAADEDLLAHVMDPLQLRYVLTYHRAETRALVGADAISNLLAACRRRDQSAVRAAADALTQETAQLPKDLPQLMRSLLLEIWRNGDGDLGMLTFCTAALDVRLYEELGWESSRVFFVQLRRITGPGCEVFDAFLTDEDVDSALCISKELRQDELIAHFSKLAKTFDTQKQINVRRSVFATAGRGSATVPAAERVSSRPPLASATPFATNLALSSS